MVFLAITRHGLDNALRRVGETATPVWCGADAISQDEFAAMPGEGLTRFEYELGTRELLPDALGTIAEHHPGEVIWVEAEPAVGWHSA